MKRFSLAMLGVLALAPSLPAQDQGGAFGSPSPSPTPAATPILGRGFWKADLPGGSYVVALGAIEAVSLQRYILDGMARVTEVNVTTAGEMKPRFYYIEALPVPVPQNIPGAQLAADRIQSEIQDLARRTVPGDPIWAKVVKNYPTTTHAGTIEFRLESQAQIQQLYNSLETAWTTGRGGIFKVGASSDNNDANSGATRDTSPNANGASQ
jgi:hypothetical protein